MSAKLGQRRGSYKPPGVQALVISKRQQDKSMRQIARETGLDRETVRNILTQPEIAQSLAEARSASIKALPDIARMVHEDTLTERDRELGFRILDKAGVYPEQNAPRYSFHDDAQLQVAIQTLLPPLPPPSDEWLAEHPDYVERMARLAPPAPPTQPEPAPASEGAQVKQGEDAAPQPGTPALPASPAPAHPPACECDACVCHKCGKQRDPRDAGGRMSLSNRCACAAPVSPSRAPVEEALARLEARRERERLDRQGRATAARQEVARSHGVEAQE